MFPKERGLEYANIMDHS